MTVQTRIYIFITRQNPHSNFTKCTKANTKINVTGYENIKDARSLFKHYFPKKAELYSLNQAFLNLH